LPSSPDQRASFYVLKLARAVRFDALDAKTLFINHGKRRCGELLRICLSPAALETSELRVDVVGVRSLWIPVLEGGK
jgi:hypothetical protein